MPSEGIYTYEVMDDKGKRGTIDVEIGSARDGWTRTESGSGVTYYYREARGRATAVRSRSGPHSCSFDPPLVVGFMRGRVGDRFDARSRCSMGTFHVTGEVVSIENVVRDGAPVSAVHVRTDTVYAVEGEQVRHVRDFSIDTRSGEMIELTETSSGGGVPASTLHYRLMYRSG